MGDCLDLVSVCTPGGGGEQETNGRQQAHPDEVAQAGVRAPLLHCAGGLGSHRDLANRY